MTDSLRVGVSSCLLGQKVRYDGGHKRDSFIADQLARFVEFVPVCPELEIGLGSPRDSIHLTQTQGKIRLVNPKTHQDLTDTMSRWSADRLSQLEKQSLSGFILKKDSPSCGMQRVRVHQEGKPPTKDGVGLFAQRLLERWPLLPVEEEGRLNDARLRENFIERVFAYHRMVHFFGKPWTTGDLVRFHTAEKLLLMAHEPAGYQELGRWVAQAKGVSPTRFFQDYGSRFMAALGHLATTRRHVNVLNHAAGYFRGHASPEERRELQSVIGDYQRELVPLVAPLVLLRSFVRTKGISYLEGQTYLYPHPKEMMLRNHV
ncbi:MAG: DUF1722 domain-containing protein [Elusimicrobia bacterium]|nr:DUF1722 domain-containing protein [Elusimicrobiota bacterium]